MGHTGACTKYPNGASWETLSLSLSRPTSAPLLTAIQGTCGVPAPLLTADLSWRYEEDDYLDKSKVQCFGSSFFIFISFCLVIECPLLLLTVTFLLINWRTSTQAYNVLPHQCLNSGPLSVYDSVFYSRVTTCECKNIVMTDSFIYYFYSFYLPGTCCWVLSLISSGSD